MGGDGVYRCSVGVKVCRGAVWGVTACIGAVKEVKVC